MKSPLTVTLAAVLALGAGATASAQTYGQAYDAYQNQRENYYDQQRSYAQRTADYEAQRRAYDDARARYDRDRDTYDRRWGRGAYERRYGAFRYDYPPSAYDHGYDASYNDAYAPYRDNPCEQRRSNNQVAGGLIGALAGAALGSNVAASGVRTEGAVLGGLVGAAVGAGVGRSTAQCDDRGYYFSYDQTMPYREGYYDNRNRWRNGSRYSYYNNRRCRLASAPATYRGATDYRYVRVCPDGSGRYRITG